MSDTIDIYIPLRQGDDPYGDAERDRCPAGTGQFPVGADGVSIVHQRALLARCRSAIITSKERMAAIRRKRLSTEPVGYVDR